jgi:hypothetical protein
MSLRTWGRDMPSNTAASVGVHGCTGVQGERVCQVIECILMTAVAVPVRADTVLRAVACWKLPRRRHTTHTEVVKHVCGRVFIEEISRTPMILTSGGTDSETRSRGPVP